MHPCKLILPTLLTLTLSGSAFAIQNNDNRSQPSVAPGFNQLHAEKPVMAPALAKTRQAALSKLSQDLGGSPLKFEDQENGSFSLLRRADPSLPLLPNFADPTRPGDPLVQAKAFIARYKGAFGLNNEGISSLRVERDGIVGATEHTQGVYYVSFIQETDGVRVHQARLTFAIHVQTGDLHAITSGVFGAPLSREWVSAPSAALQFALEALQAESSEVSRLSDHTFSLNNPRLGERARVERRWTATAPGQFTPAWLVTLTLDGSLLEIAVSDSDGELFSLDSRSASAENVELSGWDTHILQPDGSAAAPEVISYTPDSIASPSGWLTDPQPGSPYQTVGPNAIAFIDWYDEFTGYEFESGMLDFAPAATNQSINSVEFDYSGQWGNPVTEAAELSTVEAWRAINTLHDRYYNLGFTEVEGNFSGDDPVIVNVQDQYSLGARNNANMSTPRDGTSGRMNMYVFKDDSSATRDGAIDVHIVAHELGHGLSHRLVNFGDSGLSGIQSRSFGEGMSDVLAFMVAQPPGAESDTIALSPYVGWENYLSVARRGFSTFLTGDYANDPIKPMGRWTALTYELGNTSINDARAERTFAHWGFMPYVPIGDGAYGSQQTGFYGNLKYRLNPESHSDGEIFAAAVWRARHRVNTHNWPGSSTETRLAAFEQTLVMGMQLMPSNPSIIQVRDAFLIYEEMTQELSAGCMIKHEFARTGMGANAYSGNNGYALAEDDYDETLGQFPEQVIDFDPWGCGPGDFTQADGEPTVILKAIANEVLVDRPFDIELYASTPGHNTQATITGPAITPIAFESQTDSLAETIAITMDTLGETALTATVFSDSGTEAVRDLAIKVVSAEVLSASGAIGSGSVPLGDNHHFVVSIERASVPVGTHLSFTLTSSDLVDIDLYAHIDNIALPGQLTQLDADEDGYEVIILSNTADGWQLSSENFESVVDLDIEAGENFDLFFAVAGFTASDYTYRLEHF